MKLNTYKYENNGVIATIKNEKNYWSLSIKSNDRIILIPHSFQIWNTKRAAKEYAINILSNY